MSIIYRLLDRITKADVLLVLAHGQSEVINILQRAALDAKRDELDTMIAFRLHCEQPEVDVRDSLDAMIYAKRNEVARLEEQIL